LSADAAPAASSGTSAATPIIANRWKVHVVMVVPLMA